MSEVKWGTREVTNIENKPGKFGTYKVLTTLDGKGKRREERLFDKDLQALVPSTGSYKFGYELNEESGFPEIVEIESLNGSTSPVQPAKAVDTIECRVGPAQPPQQTRAFKGKEGPSTDDSILFQVCLKAAAEYLSSRSSAECEYQASKDMAKYAENLYLAAKKTLNPELSDVPF